MKWAIFGDIHGRSLKELEDALDIENPGMLICTGDFDDTRSINQFIELENKYKEKGKEVVKVPGNHDYAILNNQEISSGTLGMQGKTIGELHNELINDKIAYDYIKQLIISENPNHTKNRARDFLDADKFGEDYQTIIIHGAYDGNLFSFPNCPDNLKDVWMRLNDSEDYSKNFNEMSKEGDKIMIRGHDHHPIYVCHDPVKGIKEYIPENKSSFKLFKNLQHVINPGALFNGNFATIDTDLEENPILTYHKIF